MMNKILKHILAIATASVLLAVCLSYSACGENSAEDKYLNLPDEPVIFWNYYDPEYLDSQFLSEYDLSMSDIAGFGTGGGDLARLYSKTPIDVTNVEIKLNGSYFYYASGLKEVYNYETDSSDAAQLELFMEYNGADWDELLNLYGNDKNAYLEEIANWQARYDAVKGNISCYIYSIVISSITEELYNNPAELEVYHGENYLNLYNSGALKFYEPETDEATTLTTATFYIGDKTITHEFGEYTNIEKENYNSGFAYGNGYHAASSFQTDINDESQFYREIDNISGELFFWIEQSGGVAETREWINVTLKSVTPLNSDITIEPTEIKYINTLGVAVSEEWDGSEVTVKVRNYTTEDDTPCAFAVFFDINSSGAIPSYAYYMIYLDVTVSFDGDEDTVTDHDSLPGMRTGTIAAYGSEYYAYMVDDVDVFAREEAWGYGVKRMNDAASNWENHGEWESESGTTSSFWERYLLTGHP